MRKTNIIKISIIIILLVCIIAILIVILKNNNARYLKANEDINIEQSVSKTELKNEEKIIDNSTISVPIQNEIINNTITEQEETTTDKNKGTNVNQSKEDENKEEEFEKEVNINENKSNEVKINDETKKKVETQEKQTKETKSNVNSGKKENTHSKEQDKKTKIITLNDIANKVSENYSNVEKIEYGKSVMDRPLEAYLIKGNGDNTKTIFMEFEVHGFEDEYAKDGKILVNLANELVEHYAKNPDSLINYQMIIVPSANPDGVIYGKNNLRVGKNNAFGRCTAAGIDINRDFKTGSFKAIESQKLKELMDKYPMNIHLDFHGWEDSCIGNPTIVSTFLSEVGLKTNKSNRYGNGQGYVIEYTKEKYGANSALVEFKNSHSVKKQNVINAINSIMGKL